MSTAYQHRPLSKFLVPQGDSADARKTEDSAKPKEEEKARSDEQTVPEKFKGKTLADVIEMQVNADRELGRLRNEVGTYRGLVTDLSRLRRTPEETETKAQEPLDVSGNDLLANPVEAITKVVQHATAKDRAEAAQQKFQNDLAAAEQTLFKDFPKLNETVGSEQFQEFASRTPSRQRDFQAAAKGEGLVAVEAARRLLEDFNDYNTALDAAKSAKETAVQAAKKVATESGGSSGKMTSSDRVYESDVLELIEKNPAKWRSPQYQSEITKAIREGRFVKNS